MSWNYEEPGVYIEYSNAALFEIHLCVYCFRIAVFPISIRIVWRTTSWDDKGDK